MAPVTVKSSCDKFEFWLDFVLIPPAGISYESNCLWSSDLLLYLLPISTTYTPKIFLTASVRRQKERGFLKTKQPHKIHWIYNINKTDGSSSISTIQFYIQLNTCTAALNQYSSLGLRALVALKLLKIQLSIFVCNEAAIKWTKCLETSALLYRL